MNRDADLFDSKNENSKQNARPMTKFLKKFNERVISPKSSMATEKSISISIAMAKPQE